MKIICNVKGIKYTWKSEFWCPHADLINLAGGVPTSEKYSPHEGKMKFNTKNEEW